MDIQSKREKIYSGFVAIFSSGGGISAFINLFSDYYIFPIISLIFTSLTVLIVILDKFYPLFLLNSYELQKLVKLYGKYSRYSDDLHNIFLLVRWEKVSPPEGQMKLTTLNDKNVMIKIDASNLFGTMDKKLNDIAAKRSDSYLNEIYNS
jgi:hypothetical protein